MAKLAEYPEISLQMTYQEETETLIIHPSRVSGLPHRTDGKLRTTFVRLFLVPKFSELLPRPVASSEIKRESNEPVFSKKVEYQSISSQEIINSALHVEVLEYSCFHMHKVLGNADLHLVHVEFVNGDVSLTLPLEMSISEANYGTISVSLEYMQQEQKLNVWLMQAKDLVLERTKGTEIQARMWLSQNGKQVLEERYTSPMTASNSLSFSDEAFSWSLENAHVHSAAINIALMNQNVTLPHMNISEIGHATISKQHSSWVGYMHWTSAMNSPGRRVTEWHELVKNHPKKEYELKACIPQLSMQLEYKTVRETLTVKIERASWCQDSGAQLSVFIRLSVIPQLPSIKQRADVSTHIIIAENSATFNEEVEFESMNIQEFYNSILKVELVDYHFIEDTKVKGQKCFPLSEIPLVKGKARLNPLLEPPKDQSSALVSLIYNVETQTLSYSLLMVKDIPIKNQTEIWGKIEVTDGNKLYEELTTRPRLTDGTLVFSETLRCHLEDHQLGLVTLRTSIFTGNKQVGEVCLNSQSTGEALRHWKEFLSDPSKSSTNWFLLSQEISDTSVVPVEKPVISKDLLIKSMRKEPRHRSTLVTEADKTSWKKHQRRDDECKKTVFRILKNTEKKRPWSDIIRFPDSILKSQEIMKPKNTKAELSLLLTYSAADATLTVKLDKATGLQCPVYGHLSQEKLARIAHGVPVNAVAHLYLQHCLTTLPLRKSKKTKMKKFDKEIVFAEEIRLEEVSVEELDTAVLHVGVLGCDFEKEQLMGHAQLVLPNVPIRNTSVVSTLPLKQHVAENIGSVRISLLYQKESNELEVLLLRAKDLNNQCNQDTDAQARIQVVSNCDCLGETYSSIAEKTSCPCFNHSLLVKVDPSEIRDIEIFISLKNKNKNSSSHELGQVALSCRSSGPTYRYWNDAIASPGERLTEWHELCEATKL